MRYLFNAILTALLITLVAFVGGSIYLAQQPDVSLLKNQYPVFKLRTPEKVQVVFEPTPPAGWVPLHFISKQAVGAIVVSEDWAFFQHSGFDLNQIKDAIEDDIEKKSFVRGASTITQQVAKNLFLNRDKSLWRKLKEVYFAVLLEKKVGKKKILEIYMNVAEWGDGIYGIGNASQYYFQKEPSVLSAKEGAFLAMLLPSPKRYSQSFKNRALTQYASKTVTNILEKMVRAQYLTEEEHQLARQTRLSFESEAAESKNQQLQQEDALPEENDI
jgi:monofunctional glycosyltransferase